MRHDHAHRHTALFVGYPRHAVGLQSGRGGCYPGAPGMQVAYRSHVQERVAKLGTGRVNPVKAD